MARIDLQRMPKNPITQALSLLVFGVVLVVAILMGAIVLAFAVAFAAVFAVVFWLRMWWVTRKLRRRQARSGSSRQASGSDYLEVDYRVVDEHDDDDAGRRGR